MSKCSWTIFTFGKFSQIENVVYLEKAYEKKYADSNPILAYRCLGELQWLGSQKLEQYLAKLYENNDIISKLTLLMYWQCRDEAIKIDKLLLDRELIKFISPNKENPIKDEILFLRLGNFENYFFQIHNEDKKLKLTVADFINIAKKYFDLLQT